MKKVYIASTNPVKIQSVKNAFEKTWPGEAFEFQGISSPSGVSDQPMTSDETLLGATNRVQNLMEIHAGADYYVGLEGGLEERNGTLEVFAWMIIRSEGRTSESCTATFVLPPKVAELIHQGYELGTADDMVFGTSNSKQQMGSVGLLTHGLVDRASYYEQALILALIPHRNVDLY